MEIWEDDPKHSSNFKLNSLGTDVRLISWYSACLVEIFWGRIDFWIPIWWEMCGWKRRKNYWCDGKYYFIEKCVVENE